MNKILIDKNSVIFEYNRCKSLVLLKNKFGCDKRTLKKILVNAKCYNEPYIKDIPENIVENIIIDYVNRIPISKIGEKYFIGRRRIVKLLKENNITDHQNHKFDFDRDIFKNIDNEKKSYWLGFLYADGSVYKSKDNISHHLTIKLSSKDINHLYKFKNDFNLPQDIKLRKENSFGKEFESARIRICSKEIVNDLIRHGCLPNKTFVLQFPHLNAELISHFMRGYFDGDGSISLIKKTLDKQFTVLGNYDFICEYQGNLIKNCNINKTKIIKKNNIYFLHYGGNLNIKKIYDYFYRNHTTCLERKEKIFKSSRTDSNCNELSQSQLC